MKSCFWQLQNYQNVSNTYSFKGYWESVGIVFPQWYECSWFDIAFCIVNRLYTRCEFAVDLYGSAIFYGAGSVSTVSGVLNACTYVRSAVSPYGVARLSGSIGWQNTVFVWYLIAFAGTTICFLSIRSWNKRFLNTITSGTDI